MTIEEAKAKVNTEIALANAKLESEKARMKLCIDNNINASFDGYKTAVVELYMLESFANLLEKGRWD